MATKLVLANLEPAYVENFLEMVRKQGGVVEHWLLTANEQKLARLLVRKGTLQKGTSECRQGQRIYILDDLVPWNA